MHLVDKFLWWREFHEALRAQIQSEYLKLLKQQWNVIHTVNLNNCSGFNWRQYCGVFSAVGFSDGKQFVFINVISTLLQADKFPHDQIWLN